MKGNKGKIQGITTGEIRRYHCPCDQQGKYSRRHAYLYYGEGDPGLPEDSAGRDRI